MLTLMMSAAALAAPEPIQTQYDDDQVLATLPTQTPAISHSFNNPDQLADRVQAHLAQARTSGDPRFLGYAQRLLQDWPSDRLDSRLRILRATLWQSLHRFDDARTELKQVLASRPDALQENQALLTLANLDIVQGRYSAAERTCQQLSDLNSGLIADSCLALVAARTGQPEMAYQSLLAKAQHRPRPSDPISRAWTQATLADIAAQLGRREAEIHWRRTLVLTPGDLYSRAQFADWLIQQRRYPEAIVLTEGYETVDTLAVLRAIALAATDQPAATALIDSLQQRFAEARWRGNLLHQRDYARFLLDIEQQPQMALKYARNNWQNQREPLDTRLLLRAAQASNDRATLESASAWLSQMQQRDTRFPETQP